MSQRREDQGAQRGFEPPAPVGAPQRDLNQLRYTFFCNDLADEFQVDEFRLVEELNRPFRMTLHLSALDETTSCARLLGRNVSLLLERVDHARVVYGIVERVTIEDSLETRQACRVEIAPALSALSMTTTSRIFQEKTGPEIAVEVLREELGAYQRTVDDTSLERERYETRAYCVQYQETSLDFVHRLLEEEGVGYYFTHEDSGPETIVLFDVNASLPEALTIDGGPLPFDGSFRTWVDVEPILRFRPSVALASSAVTVRDHDWTRGRPTVEGSEAADGEIIGEVAESHEVYEHGLTKHLTIHEDDALFASMVQLAQHAVIPGGLPFGLDKMVFSPDAAPFESFTSSDAQHQAAIRRQLHDRDRVAAKGVSLVSALSAGRTFDLRGHPTLGADGAYYVTKVTHSSQIRASDRRTEDSALPEGTNYQNRFECRPTRVPWRPDRATPKPRINGVQTAKVTGPVGMDVHTDAHGRVLVKFPWDRSPANPSGRDTCWIRVSQAWAGQGFPGFVFIPRVGMEVVIAFVEGDPDRPLVTGCVYNGENPTPNMLPLQATKSILRTRTVPHGPGHNELSFEDAMGRERVHLRAERDLDELVQHDHLTKVNRNQRLRVGQDQTVTVDRHQHVEIRGHQELNVHGPRTDHCNGDHVESSGGAHSVYVMGGSYLLDVPHGTLVAESGTGIFLQARNAVHLRSEDEQRIEITADGETPGICLDSKGPTIQMTEDSIELTVGSSKITIRDGAIQVNHKTFPSGEGT